MTGVTQKVEAWLDNDSPPQLPEKPAAVESVDLQPAYLEEIAQKVNLDLIRSAVKLMAPSVFSRRMAQAMAGVGTACWDR